jgi:predicted nuclease of restriction endonuclease-like RecB superfamily
MLTGDLLRASVTRSSVTPRFVDPDDPGLVETARALTAAYEMHVGRSRGELKTALEGRAQGGDRVRLERGLAKLLADRSTFERASTLDPETARAVVYEQAALARAQGTFVRERVLEGAATLLATRLDGAAPAPPEIDAALDADRKIREHLLAFDPIEPRALLVRYNVALCQAVLLRATRVVLEIEGPPRRLRHVLRAIKFRRLLFRASRGKGRRAPVLLELDGPLSLFGPSTKYGLALAEVLPAVLLCERFSLEAVLAWGKKRLTKTFVLETGHMKGASGKTWLRSPIADPGAMAPPELEAFARRFEAIAPGWKVDERVPIVFVGEGEEQDALVPDLRFVHAESGRTGYLEVLAAARRGSVARRLELLARDGPPGLVVAVAKSLIPEGEALPPSVVVMRSMPDAREVLERLEGSPVSPGGGPSSRSGSPGRPAGSRARCS